MKGVHSSPDKMFRNKVRLWPYHLDRGRSVDSRKEDFYSLLLIAVLNESFPVAFHAVGDVDDIDGRQA